MRLYIYFSFVVFVTLNSHTRIISDAKTIDPSRTLSKTDTTKIASRSTNEADQVFTIRTDAGGKASQTCQCVQDNLCDKEDVYNPSESESLIKCGSQQTCCIRPQLSDDPQSTATNSQNDSSGKCVDPNQCDPATITKYYGSGSILIRRPMNKIGEPTTFPECPVGMIFCPDEPPISSADNCTCINPRKCTLLGGIKLQEKLRQCDISEVCCPQDAVDPWGTNPTPTIPTTPTPPTECGIRKEAIHSKLAGFSDTVFGEFPWMIVILERVNGKEKVKCGGSLVSKNLVLTAAHCLENSSIDSFIVRAGEHNLNTPSDSEEQPHQDRVIKNATKHFAFFRQLLLNDLALIEVDMPFDYSPHVTPVCLPLTNSTSYSADDTSIYDLDRCVASGWGSKDTGNPTPSAQLNKIDLKIIPSDQCVAMLRKSPLGPNFTLHPSLICAMGNPGVDTCKGDGGGPLVCPLKSNPNKYVQLGVIAGGLACSSPFPGLYASLLLNNNPWISETIYFKNTFLS